MTFNFLFYLIIFVFGLVVGSFLNCLIYRLQVGIDKSFLKGRSYCPLCRHRLNWQDLIPVFSFLILKGKCRYCHQKISFQYPLVELTTGILFLLTFNFQFSPKESLWFPTGQAIFNFIIACLLIIIFVYDLKHYIIPDKIIYPAIGAAFLYKIYTSYFILHASYFIVNSLEAAFAVSIFFLTIILISRGKWMGLGDAKLAFFMGLFLGWPDILPALFFAFFLGAIIGLGLIAFGRKTLKSEVPFGPFLVTGTFIALFWGQNLINWYLNMLTT